MPTELIRTTLLALALLAMKTSAPTQCTVKVCAAKGTSTTAQH